MLHLLIEKFLVWLILDFNIKVNIEIISTYDY